MYELHVTEAKPRYVYSFLKPHEPNLQVIGVMELEHKLNVTEVKSRYVYSFSNHLYP